MASYSLGEVSGLVSDKTKSKKKNKKSDGGDAPSNTTLQSLFGNDNLEKQKAKEKEYELAISKAALAKKEKKKKKEVKADPVAVEGFCPPKGIQHISLVKEKTKKKKRLHDDDDEDLQMFKKMKHDENEGQAARRRLMDKDKNVHKVDPCTIFVGNLPISYNKKDIKKLFIEYGAIDSLRIRSVMPSEIKLPKKAAVMKKNINKECTSLNAFVRFQSEESAVESLKSNGLLVDEHHIRVDLVTKAKKLDHKHSVFIGNLPLDVKNDELWNHFEDCGTITNVRLVRDKATNLGKGFGFVTFEDTSSVALAMKLNSSQVKGRKIRVMVSVKKQKMPKSDKGSVNKNVRGNRRVANPKTTSDTSKKHFINRPSNAGRGSFNKPKLVNKKKKDNKVAKLKQFRNKKRSQKTKSTGNSKKKVKKSKA